MFDLANADFQTLLDIVEARYRAWYRKEIIPERDRRVLEVKQQNLEVRGREILTMRIDRELMERAVREHIRIYGAVAHEAGNVEMLSGVRLDEFRKRIMRSVAVGCAARKGEFERRARAAGDTPMDERRYADVKASILDVVNVELRVLEVEGKVVVETGKERVATAQPIVPARLATPSGSRQGETSAAGWEDLQILFLSDERVEIRKGTNSETRNYEEFGFADRRNRKPNNVWLIFRALAVADGTLRNAASRGLTWAKVEKHMQELRKALRKHFGIAADPLPFVKDTGYVARFKIRCSPAYDT